jgi:chitin disaccharide deacetylase
VQRDGARSGRSGGAPDAGLTPTHLDWHCLADGGRADIFDVTLMLADEYGIAVRAWLEPARRKLRDRGLPVVGHDFSWVRQTEHEFLVSGRAREVVEEEGITVIGWSTLLEQWQHPPGTAPAR